MEFAHGHGMTTPSPTKKNLTPAQAAAYLAISASTLRRWSADFAEHLSPAAHPGPRRRRSYTPGDLAMLARAAELLHAGKAPGEVDALLGVTPDLARDTPAGPAGVDLLAVPVLAGQLADAHELVRRLAEEVRAERDRGAQLAGELEATRGKVESLEARLTALEAQQVEGAQGGRSWWDRLQERLRRRKSAS